MVQLAIEEYIFIYRRFSMGKLLAGWAETSLVPDKKVRLMGQFFERISEYVETPVTATALALSDGSEHVVFCSCDLEGVYIPLVKRVRSRLSGIDGLDPEKVILSATHDHTSLQYTVSEGGEISSLDVLRRYLPADRDYAEKVTADDSVMSDGEALEFLADRIAEVVRTAWSKLSPAYMQPAFGRAAVGMCRRTCYDDGSAKMWGDTDSANFTALEGGNDSGIELIYLFDEEKHITGIVANVACPAQIVEQRSYISSDYWGKVKSRLRDTFGQGLFLLGLCAPAGDQCPRDMIRWVQPETPIDDPNVIRTNPHRRNADPSMFDVKGTWTVGRRIASEIEAVFDETDMSGLCNDIPLCHEIIDLALPLRRVTVAERDDAEKNLREYIKNSEKTVFDYSDSAAMHVYAGTMARYEQQQRQDLHHAEIHILRIGNIAFATNPFELFLDFGNVIRARSFAQQTFLIQLACGNDAYLPTEKAEKGGHYSAYVSSGVVGHEGGDLLVRTTVSGINEMFSGGDK